ncbi:hypothetical protein GCM10009605_26930 [Nocardiopsis composta]
MDPLHPHDPPAIGPFRLLGRLGEDAGTRRYLAEAADGTEATLAVARPERAADPLFRDAFARRVAAVRTWPPSPMPNRTGRCRGRPPPAPPARPSPSSWKPAPARCGTGWRPSPPTWPAPWPRCTPREPHTAR